jgi:hypothetical protein
MELLPPERATPLIEAHDNYVDDGNHGETHGGGGGGRVAPGGQGEARLKIGHVRATCAHPNCIKAPMAAALIQTQIGLAPCAKRGTF